MDDKQAAAIKKAQALRWKKPLVKELNLEEIRLNLSEWSESCANVKWYLGDDVEMLDELLGEDDAYEYQMSFSSLGSDIDRLQDALSDIWVPDDFDDAMAAVHPEEEEIYGYDSFEDDFFRLDSYLAEYACEQAAKRMERHTKRELIDIFHRVVGIICQYMSVKYRFDSLSASFDVLMDRTETALKAVKEVEQAYDAAAAIDFYDFKDETRHLNKLLNELPERAWIE